jgi:DNA-binding Lrp family transcriptional regulator
MTKLDVLDEKLIKLLQHDAQRSGKELAAELEIGTTTVRRRIRNLLNSNLIHIMVVVDHRRWGLNVPAFIGLNVDPNELDKVIQTLSAMETVINILITSGGFDIISLVRVASIEELDDLLRNKISHIPGVRRFETFIRLKDIKICEVIEIRRGATFSADIQPEPRKANTTNSSIPSIHR